MKFKTTKKAINQNYYNVICVGYADLSNLLQFEKPVAYYSNVYGWRADVYQVYTDAVIVTGYQPWGNISPKYEKVREYNEKARAIFNACPVKEGRKHLTNLLYNFVDKCINEKEMQRADKKYKSDFID